MGRRSRPTLEEMKTSIAALGFKQRLCWTWTGLTRNQRADVLRVMIRDKDLTKAEKKTARRKLGEMRGV